jgi:hypothetical protein
MKCFRRCAREHHYAYGLGYRPVIEAEALRFGSLAHRGLEAWWLGWQLATEERLAGALAALTGAADEYELARASQMIAGYHFRWIGEPYEVIAVEREFLAPLINPETSAPSRTYSLGGKLDAIVRDTRDGLTYKVEHKTASEYIGAGSAYWKRLTLDPQVSTYYAGARELGYDVAGCVYDVLGKPGLRPSAVPLVDAEGVKIVHDAQGNRVRTKDGKKFRQTGDAELGYVLQTRPETPAEYGERIACAIAAEPDRYYQRGIVVRLEQEERDAMFDRWQTARLIREAELAGRHPRNPDACVRWGRECDFFGVCTGTASLDDQTQFRRVENVHEELTQPERTTEAV